MEPVKLKSLIKDLPITLKGSEEVEITGITANSKQAQPGSLFLAKKGLRHEGNQFIPEAIAAGAVAVLTDIYDPLLDCIQMIYPDVQHLESVLVNRFYGYPGEKLFLIGITGTNGKTTTSYLIKHLLDQEKQTCGLIGTIEWMDGQNSFSSTHTTPDLITLTKLFYGMTTHRCQSAVMEVSSHALDQGRVKDVPFDVGIFTNLTLDHLDYHKTMENYADAKSKLFTSLSQEGFAIFNTDDHWHTQMIKQCQAQKISYGFSEQADIRASHMSQTSEGVQFIVTYKNQSVTVLSTLIGRFNIYNLLAAIGVGIVCHLSLDRVVEHLKSFNRVPGRLERVPNSKGLNIFVDHSHTDDALRNVLETLYEFKKGRIITVFGCGGTRDKSKRPKMASVAEMFSDFVIVTSDNPRSENPEDIIHQIVGGFKSHTQFKAIIDRKEAIQKAILMATPEDIVLIAGKGHETYQIFSHEIVPFDDRKVAHQATIC